MDTNIKHYIRSGLYYSLPKGLKIQIPSSNISRWKNESEDKYFGSAISQYINQNIELHKIIGQNTNIKKLYEGYFELVDVLHKLLSQVNGVIFKTSDGIKHHIHFLMDHYSKNILGFKIKKSSSTLAIKILLLESYQKLETNDDILFLTGGGSENNNKTVANFINSKHINIKHLIAQKDIQFSNSKIEAFNKIIKHQFLLPKNL